MLSIVLFWMILVLTPLLIGWDYYITPQVERAYHPQHDLFKPTGFIGHGLGILGTLLIITGVSTYSIRKRVRRFYRIGKLQHWLQFHIFLCTLGAAWVLLHTTFKFSGLVAISFWSMMLVVASGIFGRYVYVRIPKTSDGSFWNLEHLERERAELSQQLEQVSGLHFRDLSEAGFLIEAGRKSTLRGAIALAFQYDFRFFTSRKHWRRLLHRETLDSETEEAVKTIVKRLVTNAKQKSIIQPFQKLFNYWHVFHIPLTAVMFIILGIHVIVALIFGYFWIF